MGEREFAIATAVLRATGFLSRIRILIGVLCISLALLSAIEQFNMVQPLGPHGIPARAIHLTILVSALIIGVLWIVFA